MCWCERATKGCGLTARALINNVAFLTKHGVFFFSLVIFAICAESCAAHTCTGRSVLEDGGAGGNAAQVQRRWLIDTIWPIYENNIHFEKKVGHFDKDKYQLKALVFVYGLHNT